MLKKRLHNHNNNQTNPKKQPYTKNKPTTNPPKKYTHKKTHNNNQTKTKNTKPTSHKQFTACSAKSKGFFFYQTTNIFPDSHQFGIKKYWLYSLCCFVLPLPNLSLAVKIFSVANSREAMYIMTIVKIAT